jgi:DHA2 family multidrug resistance protein
MASTARPGRSAQPGLPAHFRDEPEFVADNYFLLIVGVMLASLAVLLDTTITIVAVPHMQASLGASPDTITWVLTSYIIASAVFMPITGWLSDRIGQRNLFILAVSGFIGASMLCGAAQNLQEIVLFRAIQGFGGAFIMPLGQAVMLDATRPSRRSQIMALWGIGVVMGPVLGPVLGGFLTENWNWRWVFYVNLPVGGVAIALLLAQLPHRPKLRRPFDIVGFLLVGTALAALQLMLDRGPRLDWFDSYEIWIWCGLAISALWMAVIHLFTAEHPLFDRHLFADVNLMTAVVFIFIVGMILFSSMALLPTLLQDIIGYGVIETGMMLAMRGIGVLMSMQVASFLVRREVDARIMVGAGFLGCALSLYMMSAWSLAIKPWDVALPGLVQGLGVGLVFIPLNVSAFATLPSRLRTDASSLMNLFRSIGSSLGISVLTAVLSRNWQVSHADLAAHIDAATGAVINLSAVSRLQPVGGALMSFVDGEINRQAALIAYIDDFHVMMIMALCTAPLVLLMKKPPHHITGA